MKPRSEPPKSSELFKKYMTDLGRILPKSHAPSRYLHWEELRRRTPPDGLTHEEWWFALKVLRSGQQRAVPLRDCSGGSFHYVLSDPVPEHLHKIDQRAAGSIQMPDQITNPETKDRYYVGSLIEEATTSSMIEGATTTRRVAKHMIQTGRKPADRSERMIFNNYLTMKLIGELRQEKLTKEMVFRIHEQITEETLEEPDGAGRLRRSDEKIWVGDDAGNVAHVPPSAAELDERMEAMCRFANGETPKEFMHPVLRSIILHFWLAYDHPFIDGNGRTARALFYWSMLHHGFWLFEFISISQIILGSKSKYSKSFIQTETDENDLTYFIRYHIDIVDKAIKQLHEYLHQKTKELREIEAQLNGVSALNHRQRALVVHALRHPDFRYTIQSHQTSHGVVYQTARTDLFGLVERGVLGKVKVGKRYHFTPARDLEQKLARLADRM